MPDVVACCMSVGPILDESCCSATCRLYVCVCVFSMLHEQYDMFSCLFMICMCVLIVGTKNRLLWCDMLHVFAICCSVACCDMILTGASLINDNKLLASCNVVCLLWMHYQAGDAVSGRRLDLIVWKVVLASDRFEPKGRFLKY